MAATWSDEETFKLVELWGEEEIQALLEGCTRNKHVYDKIARGMGEAGYERTGVQCRDKIKKLKTEYKKVKDNNDETGRQRKVWRFYDCMNEVLGDRPATRPPVLIDTLESDSEEVSTVDGGAGNEDVIDVEGVKVAEDNTEQDGDTAKTGEKLDDSDVKMKQVEKKPVVKRDKQNNRRRTREDKFEKAMDIIIEKVTTAQKDSDEMFTKLEEKRMKLDEQLMEMENRRLREDREREERQRREERDFQLRMMMIMQQGGMGPPPPSFASGYDYSLHNSGSSSSQWSE